MAVDNHKRSKASEPPGQLEGTDTDAGGICRVQHQAPGETAGREKKEPRDSPQRKGT